eukprot:6185411-Pleurochrysis_carterae.AAC.5
MGASKPLRLISSLEEHSVFRRGNGAAPWMIEHSLRRARAGQIHSTGMLTVRPSRAAPSTAAVSLGALLLTASLLGLGTLQRRAPRMTCEKDLSQARIQGLFAWKSAAPWQPGVSYSEAISMLQQLVTDDFTYTVTGLAYAHFTYSDAS